LAILHVVAADHQVPNRFDDHSPSTAETAALPGGFFRVLATAATASPTRTGDGYDCRAVVCNGLAKYRRRVCFRPDRFSQACKKVIPFGGWDEIHWSITHVGSYCEATVARPVPLGLHADLFQHTVGAIDFSQRLDNPLTRDVDGAGDLVGVDEAIGKTLDIAVEEDADHFALRVDSRAAGIASVRIDGGHEVERR